MRPRLVFCLSPIVLLLTGCFPHHAGPRLAHFEDEAPAVGDPAPEFTLYDLDGNAVELSSLIGEKPIVLRFGSHSCPVYRYRRFSMEGVIEDYDDRVHFLTIYTREAHPVDSKSPYAEGEWDFWLNRALGIRVREPATEDERAELARASHEKLNLPEPMAVDNMDNSTWEAYGSASSPAFVIDRDGKVALRQAWVIPKEIREVLDELLDRQAEPTQHPRGVGELGLGGGHELGGGDRGDAAAFQSAIRYGRTPAVLQSVWSKMRVSYTGAGLDSRRDTKGGFSNRRCNEAAVSFTYPQTAEVPSAFEDLGRHPVGHTLEKE